jgi:hypothetical protein
MSGPFREIRFRRLAYWHLKLFISSAIRGTRRRLGQQTFFALLGAFWVAFIGLTVYAALNEALERSPEAVWLPGLLLHSAWLGALAMTLFFNVGFLLHVLFFSRDLAFLMAAPVRPAQILGIRFVQAMWANLFFSLFLSLPITVAVGIRLGAGALYYTTYAVAIVSFLAIPVAFTYLIGIPLARWVSTARLRAIFSIFGFFVAIGLWALPYMAPARITSYRQWQDLLQKGEAVHSFFSTPQAQFLPSTWASAALVHALSGDTARTLLSTGGMLLIALTLAVGAVQLGARFYLDGWIRMIPVGETRPVRSERFAFLLGWLPGRWRPIFWKDFSIVTRDFRISFQLYSLGILMCLFPFLTLLGERTMMPEESRPLAALASALGASVIVASQAGMMAVPLEGRAGFRLLAAPLSALEIAATKWLVAVVLTLPVVAGQVGVISLAFRRPITESLIGGVLSLSGALLGAGFGVFMGAAFGNFQWDHPKRMLRSGAQLGWVIGVGAIVGILTIVIQVGVVVGEDVAPHIFRPILPLAALVLSTSVALFSVLAAARRISRLEWVH